MLTLATISPDSNGIYRVTLRSSGGKRFKLVVLKKTLLDRNHFARVVKESVGLTFRPEPDAECWRGLVHYKTRSAEI